jgi:tetratricopeptide (TPR) repeat protein
MGKHSRILRSMRRPIRPFVHRAQRTWTTLNSSERRSKIRERLARENPTITWYQRDLAASHNNTGNLLNDIGRPDAALESYTKALAIRERLARENPTITRHQLDLAERHRRAYDTARHALAARLWAEALDADPKLADDRQPRHRYNAACAAAIAGSGQGKDDPPPDDVAKAKLRAQALGWLTAELTTWTTLLETAKADQRAGIVQTLQHWQQDAELAGVREAKAIEALPESEREVWRALWKDVAAAIGPGEKR